MAATDGASAEARAAGGARRQGRARRAAVRVFALLGLVLLAFLLGMVATDALRQSAATLAPAPPGSVEARLGAARPGELVHVVGTVAALALSVTALGGLLLSPSRSGSAVQATALGVALLAAGLLSGNPDNHGGQAGLVDPVFLVLAVLPLTAGLLAVPWRARLSLRRAPAPVLLSIAGFALLPYGVGQALLQRNTWPPAADPHHQAHWFAMALLAFLLAGGVVGATVRAPGWRAAGLTSAASAVAVGIASLLAPRAGSAMSLPAAVALAVWGVAVGTASWRDRDAAGAGAA